MTRGDISCFPRYCRGGDTVMGDECFVRVFQYLPIVSGVFFKLGKPWSGSVGSIFISYTAN